MAVAFSEQERKEIQKVLKSAGRECIVRLSAHNTTEERLALALDIISKNTFYGLYDAKEVPSLDVPEENHTAIYDATFADPTQTVGKSVLFRPDNSPSGEHQHAGNRNPYLPHPENKMPRTLRKAFRPPIIHEQKLQHEKTLARYLVE